MKFMMNGALTVGTRDGATIEMAEEAGEENLFLFGLTVEQVENSRAWYNPHWHYENEPETRAALDLIFSDHFSRNEPGVFAPLRDTLLTDGDHYMHLADLTSYCQAQERLGELYADPGAWARKAILNVASSGKFSSDRTIAEYATEIWKAEPMPGTLEKQSMTSRQRTTISPLAGKPAPKEMLIDVARLEKEYFERRPDLSDPNQLVSFGTSGHRGSPLHGTFTEAHILAITQAICDYRREAGNRRSSLHGERHPCGLRSRAAHRTRGAGGEQRGDDHSAERRRNSDPGHLARHSRLQPRSQGTPR